MRHYNSGTKRHSDLWLESFCGYCYRPGTCTSYLTFCSRKPLLSTTSGYNYNSRTKRHSNLRFEPICNYRYRPFTFIPDFTFCTGKPQLVTTSAYYCNSRTKRNSDLQFEPVCSYCYRPPVVKRLAHSTRMLALFIKPEFESANTLPQVCPWARHKGQNV